MPIPSVARYLHILALRLDALSADARFALRYFARHKGTTAIILAVIALATGGNAMIFSTFQAEFLRPAPAVSANDSHVRIYAQERATRDAGWQSRDFSGREYTRLTQQRDVFQSIAGWVADDVVLKGDDSTGARSLVAQFVTPNYFSVLGLRLAAGSGLRQVRDGTPDMSAVMSYAMAEQLYGHASAALGRQIRVNEVAVQVVGVAPPRFQGAVRHMNEPALWMPVSARADISRLAPRWLDAEPALSLFARLAPSASRERATHVARQIVGSALPDSALRVGMSRTAGVIGLQALPPGNNANEVLFAFTVMTAIAALILLVGWMNVSSLMVAAAVARRHEISVRLSLGASRARLMRQLVTESTLLALAGGAIGLTLAWWRLSYMSRTEIDAVDITPDFATFAFVLTLALITGIVFGLSPALHATRGDVANALRDSGAGSSHRSRLQRGFVVAQIALSQPLLVLLGTMLALIVAEYHPLPPEMSSRVISVTLRPLATGAPGQRPEAVDSLIPRIAERVEIGGAVPEATAFAIRGIVAADRAPASRQTDSIPTIVHLQGTAPGWFKVLDVPIILGRDITLADTAAADYPVVIGSDLARALWGNANPVGRTLASPGIRGLQQLDSISMTVVGVYDASRQLPGMTWAGATARTDRPMRLYTGYGKHWRHDVILVRTRGPAAPFLPELQRFIRLRAPSLPVASMMTLAQIDERTRRETLQTGSLAGAGGALALLLASLGLYGVVALAVRQRTREIGIRIAVGAEPRQVARMFLASGVRAGAVALVIGLPLSIAGLKIGMTQGAVIAPGVNVYLIGGVIATLLLAVASFATWVPARRAALVDPARTLRVD